METDDKQPMAGEPTFQLMARDPHAPLLVVEWASMREAAIERGERPESDRDSVQNAREVALCMIAWRQAHDGAWRQQNPELPGIPEGVKYAVAPVVSQESVHPFVFTRQRWPNDPLLDGLGGSDVVHSTPTFCDCERGHNGLGLSGRECDCRQPGLGGDCDGSCTAPRDPCALDGPPRTFPPDFEMFPKAPHLQKDK